VSIKSLGKQSLIYGAGHILARSITFLLLPLYSHKVSVYDYGIVSLIFVLIAFANVIYLHGMDSALLRYYGMEKDSVVKAKIFSTSWWWICGISIIITTVLLFFAQQISIATVGIKYNKIIMLACGILFFDALANPSKILLRLQNKPFRFITIEMINVVLLLCLNVWWIGIQGFGIQYIFISNLIASAVVTLLLIISGIHDHKIQISKQYHSEMLAFALPYIPAGMASMTNELIDRYIIKWLLDENAVGFYSAGYKLGIFMLLVTMGFKFAWQPFFLGKTDEVDAHKIFTQVGTWFIAISLFIVLTITFFINDMVRFSIFDITFLGEQYWHSTSIVPVVLLAYVFLGIFTIQLAGIYIRKKSKWIPILTGSAAVLNIICNIIFIQKFGWQGAAWATLVGYMFMVVFQYFVVIKFYPLKWDWRKLNKLIILFLVLIGYWKYANVGTLILFIMLLIYCGATFQIITNTKINNS